MNILEMNTLRFFCVNQKFFLIIFMQPFHIHMVALICYVCSCTQIWSLDMKTPLIAYVNFERTKNKHFVSMCSHIVMVINVCNGYIS
jgi:hypothetical protein